MTVVLPAQRRNQHVFCPTCGDLLAAKPAAGGKVTNLFTSCRKRTCILAAIDADVAADRAAEARDEW